MPAVYDVSSYLEKPIEQEISMKWVKWVATVNLIPGFWKDMNIVTDGPADPAQLIKVRAKDHVSLRSQQKRRVHAPQRLGSIFKPVTAKESWMGGDVAHERREHKFNTWPQK